jgi:hypothetical protein
MSLSGLCICLFPFEVSSSFSRILLGSTCRDNEICMVYLNVAENTNTEMIVKFHTKLPLQNTSSVYFDTMPKMNISDYRYQMECVTDDMRDVINDETRIIHTCFLKNLTSSVDYYFRVGDSAVFSMERKFKTANEGDNTIIAAGDASATDLTTQLIQTAMLHNPSFFMLGGDIFYTNGMTVIHEII